MKKFVTLFAALLSMLLIFSSAACGGASSSAAPDPNEVKYVSGEITGTADGMITIKADDGRELSFATGGADVSKAPDLTAGRSVEVYYNGTINGSDATGVSVIRLVQDASADAEKFVTGNILESDGATLVIQPNDGSAALTFNIVAADATGANGLVVGDDVTVYYTGAIGGSDTSGASVTRLTQDASQVHSHAAAPAASFPEPPERPTTGHTEHSVTGTITYCDGATLTMNTMANLPLSFIISGADATGANGLAEGSQVTVYYTGDLRGTDTSKVAVTRLAQDAQDAPAPQATGDNSVYGLITYSDGATITIQTASGQSMSFLVAGADSTGANGLAEGTYVTIYYTGAINGDDTSGVRVTRLAQ